MRVLVTSSRFFFALDEIRKFGQHGHRVCATDTFKASAGLHSKYVHEAVVTDRPAFRPMDYIKTIENVVRTKSIDFLVPSCEEVFVLSSRLKTLTKLTDVFFSPLDVLLTLHNKQALVDLASSLSLAVPRTQIAISQKALRFAAGLFEEYIARPAFSRGGTMLLTNTGPLAGRIGFEDCHPTPQCLWLVQQFVHGTPVCSFSIAHHGKISAHCAYVIPKKMEHAGGISFESVDEPESLTIASRIVQALGYHGQISFDFIKTPQGLYLLECNPRPTAGVLLMPAQDFIDAVLHPSTRAPTIVPPGVRAQSTVALFRDMYRDWRAIPSDLRAITSGVRDVYYDHDDPLPGLYQFLAYRQIQAYRRHRNTTKPRYTDLVEAQFYDVAWNGDPIP